MNKNDYIKSIQREDCLKYKEFDNKYNLNTSSPVLKIIENKTISDSMKIILREKANNYPNQALDSFIRNIDKIIYSENKKLLNNNKMINKNTFFSDIYLGPINLRNITINNGVFKTENNINPTKRENGTSTLVKINIKTNNKTP